MIFEKRFQGRKAVITGGAAGLGHGIAERIKAEGGTVEVWDINADALAALEMDTRQIDVTNAGAVDHAMQEAYPDILVCSAGITGPNTTTWNYPVEEWLKVHDLNLNAVFYCNRAAAPMMRAKGWGRIINIASIAGKEGNPNAPAYSASKAGVIGLTKSLGKELATSGVTCNAIAPAAVRTAIFDQMTQEHIDFMQSKIPMGRFGTVEEIASMTCWLASDEASFTTGFCFDQSGGRATA
ncbi:SDR family NAD(P)-dependent oxidoreductase [uncultured Tateyamaria sp.]|uniref:SDR family NAD(P)-dependent oxidoreductase n=1 Tax=uncultured Tateyamaria sp. TaxID=455651 RepID=UPI0026161C48|nr:SDR family NAD(P)-dependent oxidoreductase [uncultured Tateyamaria sp.]